MKKLKKVTGLWLIMAATLFNASLSAAQDVKKLNMKDAVKYSLENHPSNMTYYNNIKVAKQRATEALSGYLPQINGTGTLDDNIKRQITVIPAGFISPKEIQLQLGTQYLTNLYGELDQVIYDQAQLDGLKANVPNTQIALLQKSKNDDDLVYNTATAYYQVLIYKEQEKLLTENERKLFEILTIQKLQYEKGVIKKVDYDRTEVNYKSILSQKELAKTNIELSMNQLKNAIGMPLENVIVIDDSLKTSQEPAPPALANNYNEKNNWDYKIQLQNVYLQQIDLSRKRDAFLPTFTGYARYGAQALDNNFENQYKNFYDYSVIGVKLNVPVFSGFRRYSQLKQSEYNLSNAKVTLTENSNSLRLQMLNANTKLMSSYTTLISNKENLDLAKDVLQTTTLQYQQGVASSSDLLNSDYSLKEAQSNYINSLYNYLISTLDIQKNQGTIKQYINQL